MADNNINNEINTRITEALSTNPVGQSMLEAHDMIMDRSFVESVDWNIRKIFEYVLILKDIMRTFDPESAIGKCKIEAFSDILSFLDITAAGMGEDERFMKDRESIKDTADKMLNEWQDELINNSKIKLYDFTTSDSTCECIIIYNRILEEEIESTLSVKLLCEKMNIPFTGFLAIKLETLTAVFDIYESYVREQGYTDGDFETEICQTFFKKWQKSLEG